MVCMRYTGIVEDWSMKHPGLVLGDTGDSIEYQALQIAQLIETHHHRFIQRVGSRILTISRKHHVTP